MIEGSPGRTIPILPADGATGTPVSRRVPELDGIRGVAILLILAFHLAPGTLYWGWAGVDLFFVLSGYLITSIILEHGDTPGFLSGFYLRRGLRIWPIYYLTIAVVAVLSRPHPAALFLHLGYAQFTPQLLRLWSPDWGPLEHTWSLALEEQYYVFWPALILLAGRRNVAPLAVGCLAGSMVARIVCHNYWLLPARCDGFALGGLLAALRAGGGTLPRRAALVAAGAGIAIVAFEAAYSPLAPLHYQTPDQGFAILAAGLLSFALVAAVTEAAGRSWLAPLRHPALTRLGMISYGVYLYHYPILLLIFGKPGRDQHPGTWARALVMVPATLVVALLSWYLVEKPLLRLKDRIPYGRPAGKSP